MTQQETIPPKENRNLNLTKTSKPSFAQTLKSKEEPNKPTTRETGRNQEDNNHLSTQSQWRKTQNRIFGRAKPTIQEEEDQEQQSN